MDKKQIIIDSVLACAIIALFILYFIPCKSSKSASEVVLSDTEKLPIAVINTDSIMNQYQFAQEASDKLMTKQEDARVQLKAKEDALQRDYNNFQKEAEDFQRKIEANAFLSRERAESEQQRLQTKQQRLLKQQQELQELDNRLGQEYVAEMQMLNQQLQDTINAFLKDFNADGKYHIIISDGVLLDKVGSYDITQEVVDALNKRYQK